MISFDAGRKAVSLSRRSPLSHLVQGPNAFTHPGPRQGVLAAGVGAMRDSVQRPIVGIGDEYA
jgi:hypothetical protein